MKSVYYVAGISLLLLSACSGNSVKDTLGLNRAAPDEFRVVSRPPLSVPPQFSLRPPSATQPLPNQLPSDKKAQSMITGADVGADDATGSADSDTAVVPVTTKKLASKKTAKKSSVGTTSADNAFLKNAGADKADPQIRDQLVEQHVAVQEQQESDSWWDILSTNPPKKETVVDAQKESQRIKTDEDSGQPVTTGDTPVKKDRDTGVLGRLLGY